MAMDKFAGIGESTSTSLEMGVPHRKGVDHVRPDLEGDCNTGSACCCSKASGIIEQGLAGTDLNQRRRQAAKIGK